jgi:hypothetical protein
MTLAPARLLLDLVAPGNTADGIDASAPNALHGEGVAVLVEALVMDIAISLCPSFLTAIFDSAFYSV